MNYAEPFRLFTRVTSPTPGFAPGARFVRGYEPRLLIGQGWYWSPQGPEPHREESHGTWEGLPDDATFPDVMTPQQVWAITDGEEGVPPDAPEIDWRPQEALPEDFNAYGLAPVEYDGDPSEERRRLFGPSGYPRKPGFVPPDRTPAPGHELAPQPPMAEPFPGQWQDLPAPGYAPNRGGYLTPQDADATQEYYPEQNGFVELPAGDYPAYGNPDHPYWQGAPGADADLGFPQPPQMDGLALPGGREPLPRARGAAQDIPEQGGWDDTLFMKRLLNEGLPDSGAFAQEAWNRLQAQSRPPSPSAPRYPQQRPASGRETPRYRPGDWDWAKFWQKPNGERRYSREESPVNYADLDSMRRAANANPGDLTLQGAYTDMLAEHDLEDEARFRQAMSESLRRRFDTGQLGTFNGGWLDPTSLFGDAETSAPQLRVFTPQGHFDGFQGRLLRPRTSADRFAPDYRKRWVWGPYGGGPEGPIEDLTAWLEGAPGMFDPSDANDDLSLRERETQWADAPLRAPLSPAQRAFAGIDQNTPELLRDLARRGHWPALEQMMRNWHGRELRFGMDETDEAPTPYAEAPRYTKQAYDPMEQVLVRLYPELHADTGNLFWKWLDDGEPLTVTSPDLRAGGRFHGLPVIQSMIDRDLTPEEVAEMEAALAPEEIDPREVGDAFGYSAQTPYGLWDGLGRAALAGLNSGFGRAAGRAAGTAAVTWATGKADKYLQNRSQKSAPSVTGYMDDADEGVMYADFPVRMILDEPITPRPPLKKRRRSYFFDDGEDPTEYAEPFGREWLEQNPFDTTGLAVSADWFDEEGDPHEAGFRRAADEYLRERLGQRWGGPPETNDGGLITDPGYAFTWPTVGPYAIEEYMPRMHSDEVREETRAQGGDPDEWWWGFNGGSGPRAVDFEFGPAPGLSREDRLKIARERNLDLGMKLPSLTDVEKAYGGITNLTDLTPKQYAELIDLMRKRRRELGHFADDDEPMMYGDLSPAKARTMLHEGVANGHEITDRQRRYFGAVSHGTNRYARADYGPAEDEAAFRGAIAANPHDLTARLAFADWLRDRGRDREADFGHMGAGREMGMWGAVEPGMVPGHDNPDDFLGGGELPVQLSRYADCPDDGHGRCSGVMAPISMNGFKQGRWGVKPNNLHDGRTNYGDAEEEAAFVSEIHKDPLNLLGHDALADWYADRGRAGDEAFRRNLSQGIKRRLETPWAAPPTDSAGWLLPGAPHGVAREQEGGRSDLPTVRTASLPDGFGERNIVNRYPGVSNGDWDLTSLPEGAWSWEIGPMFRHVPPQDLAGSLGLGPDEDPVDWEGPFWQAARSTAPQRRGYYTELFPEERLWAGIDDWANLDPRIWPQVEALMRRQHGRGERLAAHESPTAYGEEEDLEAAVRARHLARADELDRLVADAEARLAGAHPNDTYAAMARAQMEILARSARERREIARGERSYARACGMNNPDEPTLYPPGMEEGAPVSYGEHTQADFLRAIAENPEEMTNALVYADWLEEQGRGAEAAFIRHAVESSGTGAAHVGPTYAGGSRFGGHPFFESPDLEGRLELEHRFPVTETDPDTGEEYPAHTRVEWLVRSPDKSDVSRRARELLNAGVDPYENSYWQRGFDSDYGNLPGWPPESRIFDQAPPDPERLSRRGH